MNLRPLVAAGPDRGLPVRCSLADDPPPYQTDFPPEEFQARWNVVFDRIGDRAVAIVQVPPRPTASWSRGRPTSSTISAGSRRRTPICILDGRDRKATLFLPPRDARLESAEGKVLSAEDAELVKRLTGVDAVASTAGAGRGRAATLRPGIPAR